MKPNQQTKFVKLSNNPATWIEVSIDIPDELAIAQYIMNQKRSMDYLDKIKNYSKKHK